MMTMSCYMQLWGRAYPNNYNRTITDYSSGASTLSEVHNCSIVKYF